MEDREYFDKHTGYIYLKRPQHHRGAKRNGYVAKHVLVAENKLGRSLLDDEIVHHKDHNKRNNDPDNLDVLTQSEHAKLHATYPRYIKLECANCGQEFNRRYKDYITKFNNGQRTFYCNRFCMSLGFRKMPA